MQGWVSLAIEDSKNIQNNLEAGGVGLGMKSFLSRWLPVLLWAMVIFMASANPDPYRLLPARWIEPCFSAGYNFPSCSELLGRVLHISEYAVLALLTARAMFRHKKLKFAQLVLVLGLTELYALSDEIHQLIVPGRSFQLMDLGLDLLGGVIGLIIYIWIRSKEIGIQKDPQ